MEITDTATQGATSLDAAEVSSSLNQFASSALMVVILVIVAAVLDAILCRVIKTLAAKSSLPNTGEHILINIAHAVIWVSLAAYLVHALFGIDVNAVIAALGVVGVAVSLGMQPFMANFIGGLVLSFGRTIEMGERISVNGQEGIVVDFNWRQTVIQQASGNKVVLPNSLLNSNALSVFPTPNFTYTETPIYIRYESIPENKTLSDFSQMLSPELREELEKYFTVILGPELIFTGSEEYGYRGFVRTKVCNKDDPEVEIFSWMVNDIITRKLSDQNIS